MDRNLFRYMDKHLAIKLNASRKVTGILRGYDQFLNMVGPTLFLIVSLKFVTIFLSAGFGRDC